MIKDEDILEIDSPDLTAAERMYLPQILGGMRTTVQHLTQSITGRTLTVQYPEQKRPMRIDNYRGVHRLNRDPDGRVACVACFMCSTACPAHCIELTSMMDLVGRTREEMILDKEELLAIYDETKTREPRKNPKITGYPGTGDPGSHQDQPVASPTTAKG